MLRVFIVPRRWRGWVYVTTSSAGGRGLPPRQSMWNDLSSALPFLHDTNPLHACTCLLSCRDTLRSAAAVGRVFLFRQDRAH